MISLLTLMDFSDGQRTEKEWQIIEFYRILTNDYLKRGGQLIKNICPQAVFLSGCKRYRSGVARKNSEMRSPMSKKH